MEQQQQREKINFFCPFLTYLTCNQGPFLSMYGMERERERGNVVWSRKPNLHFISRWKFMKENFIEYKLAKGRKYEICRQDNSTERRKKGLSRMMRRWGEIIIIDYHTLNILITLFFWLVKMEHLLWKGFEEGDGRWRKQFGNAVK